MKNQKQRNASHMYFCKSIDAYLLAPTRSEELSGHF